jgi:hypothetical protein
MSQTRHRYNQFPWVNLKFDMPECRTSLLLKKNEYVPYSTSRHSVGLFSSSDRSTGFSRSILHPTDSRFPIPLNLVRPNESLHNSLSLDLTLGGTTATGGSRDRSSVPFLGRTGCNSRLPLSSCQRIRVVVGSHDKEGGAKAEAVAVWAEG